MSVATNETGAIPAAMPFAENEEEREKLLKQAADENSPDDASAAEIEEEELDETIQTVKTPKGHPRPASRCRRIQAILQSP